MQKPTKKPRPLMAGGTPPREPPDVAARIRARAAEMGKTLRELSALMGLGPTALESALRRMEAGASVTAATLRSMELALGRTSQWILTGEEPPGIRLRDLPGWDAVSKEAVKTHGLAPEAIEAVGEWLLPKAPRQLDAILVVALARAWADAN